MNFGTARPPCQGNQAAESEERAALGRWENWQRQGREKERWFLPRSGWHRSLGETRKTDSSKIKISPRFRSTGAHKSPSRSQKGAGKCWEGQEPSPSCPRVTCAGVRASLALLLALFPSQIGIRTAKPIPAPSESSSPSSLLILATLELAVFFQLHFGGFALSVCRFFIIITIIIFFPFFFSRPGFSLAVLSSTEKRKHTRGSQRQHHKHTQRHGEVGQGRAGLPLAQTRTL